MPTDRMGQEVLAAALLEILHQHLCHRHTDQRLDLRPQLLVNGPMTDKSSSVLGAPPVELSATVAPVVAAPLAQGVHRVAVLVVVMFEPQRELPADFGLPFGHRFTDA